MDHEQEPNKNNHYPNLFEPIEIHNHVIANRSIMGSMHTGLEEKWDGYRRLAQYFKERAEGGVGLIVTGGIAPNFAGRVSPFGSQLSFPWQVAKHRRVTEAVHGVGGKIAMQVLHTGRYAYHPLSVAPSAIKAPITPFKPKALSERGIRKTISDFANCAKLAKRAGYDGVEIMGSEGYLINQFIVTKTNKRKDRWGGSFENRCRLALEIISAVRAATDSNFIIIFRLSMLDLVDKGSSWDEVIQLAKRVEEAGASIINTGIGWHEARIPTIVTSVPRANFTWVTKKLKPHVSIPLITTNRINTPEVAEQVLAEGHADMVSMARPFLADPLFMNKAKRNQSDFINTCIACNQACLDHAFKNQTVSCLVNPRACEETIINFTPTTNKKRIAIVGAGPAGLACAVHSAERGHIVTLFDAAGMIGGQLNVANQVPGKEEFFETIRYFEKMLAKHNVDIRLNTRVGAEDLGVEVFDEVVIATGIKPRKLSIEGIEHQKVVSYLDVLRDKKKVGKSVAIIGAGGIGFDVAEFLTHDKSLAVDKPAWNKEWGVDMEYHERGGLKSPTISESPREVYLLQRTAGKVGAGLGKTSGWTHRLSLKHKKVQMMSDVEYIKIDDRGLHIRHRQEEKCLDVESVVVCAGQLSENTLFKQLSESRSKLHLIGGADLAKELDAKRAIRQGTLLAIKL